MIAMIPWGAKRGIALQGPRRGLSKWKKSTIFFFAGEPGTENTSRSGKMTIEIVDLAIEHGDFPEFFVKNNQRAPLKVSAEP